jgi:hypothetical protein
VHHFTENRNKANEICLGEIFSSLHGRISCGSSMAGKKITMTHELGLIEEKPAMPRRRE